MLRGNIYVCIYSVGLRGADLYSSTVTVAFLRSFHRISNFLNKIGSGPIQSFSLFFYVFYCSQKKYFVDADEEDYFPYRDSRYSASVVR